MKKIFFLILLISQLFFLAARAQNSDQQIWGEYMLNSPFGKAFNLEQAFSYSTLLGTPRWSAFDYAPTLEYSLNKYVDVMTAFCISYTHQNESNNTLELRPSIGARVHLTPDRRILARILLRLENRNFKDLETKDWETSLRGRVRLEFIVPINKDSYSKDKLVYSIADAEWLFATNDVNERFANRFRVRIGVGYRLSYTTRVEFVYMWQLSRNEQGQSFESSDNIFRLRVKQYLHNKKLVKPRPIDIGN